MNLFQTDWGRESCVKAGQTSARIVPLVVNSSGRYERAEDLVGLWAAVIALGALLAFFLHIPAGGLAPEPESVSSGCLLPVLVTITAGFGVGALIATQMFWIRRLFVPRSMLARNVDRRSTQAFNELRQDDRARPMVLLFVSVFERAARIVADESIAQSLPQKRLDDLKKDLEQAVRSGQLDSALPAAFGELAEELDRVSPAAISRNAEAVLPAA